MSRTESSRPYPLSRDTKVLPYPVEPRTFGATTATCSSFTRSWLVSPKRVPMRISSPSPTHP